MKITIIFAVILLAATCFFSSWALPAHEIGYKRPPPSTRPRVTVGPVTTNI